MTTPRGLRRYVLFGTFDAGIAAKHGLVGNEVILATDVDALLERVRLLLADAEMCEEPQCESCRKCIRLALSELEPK